MFPVVYLAYFNNGAILQSNKSYKSKLVKIIISEAHVKLPKRSKTQDWSELSDLGLFIPKRQPQPKSGRNGLKNDHPTKSDQWLSTQW